MLVEPSPSSDDQQSIGLPSPRRCADEGSTHRIGASHLLVLSRTFDPNEMSIIEAASRANRDPVPPPAVVDLFPAGAYHDWLQRLGLPRYALRAWRALVIDPRPTISLADIVDTPEGRRAVELRIEELNSKGAATEAQCISNELSHIWDGRAVTSSPED